MNVFIHETYQNIPGVRVIDSRKPGKNIGLFALTHGDEPVGLDIFENIFPYLEKNICSGKIFFICVNIKAYQEKKRFIDVNMNRISLDTPQPSSYEHHRLQQILPIIQKLDIALDLHSVSQGHMSMLITDELLVNEAQKIFDIQYILSDDLKKSGAVISLLIREKKIAFGLECGNHFHPDSRIQGAKNTLLFLEHFESLPKQNHGKNFSPLILTFGDEIFPTSRDFRFVKNFEHFTRIAPQEVYAQDQQKIFKNETQKDFYIGLASKDIVYGDGCGFFFYQK